MIDSNLESNGLGNSGTGLPVCHKQSPIPTTKVALIDVQNDSRSLIHNEPESWVLGLSADAVKVSGAEGLTPECPINPCYHKSWRSNGANEHLTHSCRNSDSELGKRKVQETSNKKSDFLKLRKYFHNRPELPQLHPEEEERTTSVVPASAPTPPASTLTFSTNRPSVPISLEKPGSGLPAAESNHLQLTYESEVPHSADSKGSTDQERKERFPQKPQKHCYEYDQRDYIHMLRRLSSVELSRCAVKLEKRSIQLSVEEAAKKALAPNQTKKTKIGKAIRTRASGRLREYIPVKKDPNKGKVVFDLTGDPAGPKIPGAGALCSWGPPSRGVKFRIAPPDYDPTTKKDDGKGKILAISEGILPDFRNAAENDGGKGKAPATIEGIPPDFELIAKKDAAKSKQVVSIVSRAKRIRKKPKWQLSWSDDIG
ncbi:uncharacterized protein LOC132189216 [Corylus avellana]|uniref:uncharacterized protein LOC132189216 n=1 Tax=Corylus avellana TaxID=13451 RepID=UPI00286C3152|nr:uncharacterized protein LOC132189216 [Corylus avellana]